MALRAAVKLMGVWRPHNGLGIKSRLHVDYPRPWQVSGVGRAFFRPKPATYPLTTDSECAVAWPDLRIVAWKAFIKPNPAMYSLGACSECVIQEESAGERRHHI
jgi:hypothetical protein